MLKDGFIRSQVDGALEQGLLVLFGIGCLAWAYAIRALGNKVYAAEYEMGST